MHGNYFFVTFYLLPNLSFADTLVANNDSYTMNYSDMCLADFDGVLINDTGGTLP